MASTFLLLGIILICIEKNINQQAENKDKMLNVKQAAEFLGLAVPTIYSKVSHRELPFMKRSKRL